MKTATDNPRPAAPILLPPVDWDAVADFRTIARIHEKALDQVNSTFATYQVFQSLPVVQEVKTLAACLLETQMFAFDISHELKTIISSRPQGESTRVC